MYSGLRYSGRRWGVTIAAILLLTAIYGCKTAAKIRQYGCSALPGLLCANIECEGECPKSPLINRNGKVQLASPMHGVVEVYRKPHESIMPVGLLSFPHLMAVYSEEQGFDGYDYILVGPTDSPGELFGWIRADNALTPAKVNAYKREARGRVFVFLDQEVKIYPSHHLYGRSLTEQQKGTDEIKTTPLNVTTPFVTFAYAQMDEATLLGTAPSLWLSDNQKTNSLLGWIDSSQGHRWDGILGVRTGPNTILYESLQDAASGIIALGKAIRPGSNSLPVFTDAFPVLQSVETDDVQVVEVRLPRGRTHRGREQGWIRCSSKESSDDAQKEYLFSSANLVVLSGIFQTILKETDLDKGIPVDLEKAITTAARRFRLSHAPAEESLADMIQTKFHVRLELPLLSTRTDAINGLCDDDRRQCAQTYIALNKCVGCLKSIIGEYKIKETEREIIPLKDTLTDEPEPKPYWFNFADGSRYAWVPSSFLP